MEVKMNKEIRDYQESMFMGLDLRQCVCSVLAILTAVGIYFGMRDITGQEITGWLCGLVLLHLLPVAFSNIMV